MKICVISSIFPPYTRGGAETVAYAQARGLQEAGHAVFVISCAPWAGWVSFAGMRQTLEGLRVYRFTPLNLFSIFNIGKHPAFLRLIWHSIDMVNPHTYLVVRRILLQEKPELILTHNLKGLGYSVHLAIQHSKFVHRRAKWFHTIHDLGALHPTGLKIFGRENSWFQKNPLISLYARINKKLLGDPEVVISPSQFLLDEYRKAGFFPKSKTAVIRNPVMQLESSARIYPRLSDPKGSHYARFLYVGQLELYKGVQLLLNVWREFSATHKDAELIIAGDGSLREEVTRAVSQLARARYAGFVAHEKLDELFARAHFTVLPSLAYENSPTIIGESFSAGVPVIASRIGGIPELVREDFDGFMFTPGDRSAFMAALERAYGAPWKRLHDEAIASASRFSLASYLADLQNLCQKY